MPLEKRGEKGPGGDRDQGAALHDAGGDRRFRRVTETALKHWSQMQYARHIMCTAKVRRGMYSQAELVLERK